MTTAAPVFFCYLKCWPYMTLASFPWCTRKHLILDFVPICPSYRSAFLFCWRVLCQKGSFYAIQKVGYQGNKGEPVVGSHIPI